MILYLKEESEKKRASVTSFVHSIFTLPPFFLRASSCTVGRVEKRKNGINAYGYCFLFGLWYVETRKNIFFGHRIFFVGWNLT